MLIPASKGLSILAFALIVVAMTGGCVFAQEAITAAAPDSAVLAPATPAVCAKGPESDEWRFNLTPYAWLSSVHGDVTVRGISSSVDIGVDEIIKKLNWITQVHIEAQKGNLGFYLNPSYVKISSGASAGGATDFGFRQWLVEGAMTYQLMEKEFGINGKSTSLKALAGFRYWNQQASLKAADGRTGSDSVQWTDPILGLRYSTYLNENLSFILQGDIGGFGAASDFTWSIAPVFGYQISEGQALIIGYRALGVNFTEGSGSTLFKSDVTYQGPVIGYSFAF